jgi:hypothetical protein
MLSVIVQVIYITTSSVLMYCCDIASWPISLLVWYVMVKHVVKRDTPPSIINTTIKKQKKDQRSIK